MKFNILITMTLFALFLCSFSKNTDDSVTQTSNTAYVIEHNREPMTEEKVTSTENIQEIQNLDQDIKSVLEIVYTK